MCVGFRSVGQSVAKAFSKGVDPYFFVLWKLKLKFAGDVDTVQGSPPRRAWGRGAIGIAEKAPNI